MPSPPLATLPRRRERAFLVGVEFFRRLGAAAAAASGAWTGAESLAELRDLAMSAGAEVAGTLQQRRLAPDPAFHIGRGKLDELTAAAAATRPDLVIFDSELSATQQRNLERSVGVRVIDRTQLILDTFARHARTREGQLQVELAQLEYLLPRLTGRGEAMSRLGGGIGTRGPGETQLETDRRRIHRRIRALRQDLEAVRGHRRQQRRKREDVPLATLALVGYTNAGKSSLFNRLTGAEVETSARMFATLDPTIRSLRLPSRRQVLVSDTVGFLRQLPHGLISAFRATLEEVQRAQLLLVVFDVTAPHRQEHLRQVRQVLEELEVTATPRLAVANKIDLLAPEQRAGLTAEADGMPQVGVSAHTGEGISSLLEVLDEAVVLDPLACVRLRLPFRAAALLHSVHEHGQVLRQETRGEAIELEVRLPASVRRRLRPYQF